MKRILAALFGVALIAVATAGPTNASAAANLADLELGEEQGYNAVGPDRGWNRNSEWVDIHNTSQTAAVNVKGLVLEDAWRHGQPASYSGPCNRYEVTTIPVTGGNAEELPAGHTLRIYVGAGEPKVFGTDGRMHAVYMNSPTSCGYNGQFFNNGPRKGDRFAPWDTAYISLGGQTKSKSYGFPYGFTAPTR
jgi:hypothetical protein